MLNQLERVKKKIRKRIKTVQLIEGRVIKEVQITKEEAEQLGDGITKIDEIDLIIVDRLGDITKKNCFAYLKSGKGRCYCLKKLECVNQECKFYRNDITRTQIEKSIEEYEAAIGG